MNTPSDDPSAGEPRTRREARERARRAATSSTGAHEPSREPSREPMRESRRELMREPSREPRREPRREAPAARPAPTVSADDDETTEFVAASVRDVPDDDDHEWTGFHDWESEDDDPRHGQHVSYEEMQRHRRRRAGRSCLLLVVLMVIAVAGAGYAASRVGRISLPGVKEAAPDYKGTGSGSVTILVKDGDSGGAIARTLLKAGVVKSTGAFVQVASVNPQFSKIQPGRYTLRKKMSAESALTMMLDPKSFKSTGITIPEGLWASEIFSLLSKRTGVPVADYQKVTAASIGLPASANGHLEGYLFPSTYNFGKDSSAQEQLQTMANEWRKKITPLDIPKSQLHDVMVEASLVQAESRLTDDGPKVARVIRNRVAQGMPLQLDSTIHYAEKQRGTITTTDKQRAKKGPYNSYLNTGLPPTPINNPGLSAIKSALNPANGQWLYFVTVNPETGKTIFSDTYAEQQKHEKEFHAWCQKHAGKC